jgi:hypothetical protein
MAMYRLFIGCVAAGLVGLVVFVSACSSPKPAARAAAATPPYLVSQQLWGDMKPVVSVKELMRFMIDPASDYVFDSVRIVTTKGKIVETEPKTEEDWEKVRIGAVTLAEGAYLLKVPRPFTPAGDRNNSEGPEAEELTPEAIVAKLQKDPVLWNAKIEALRNVAKQVIDIADRKATKELWDAGENLDEACESCHLIYWYPGDPALLKKLDSRLEELYGRRSGTRKMGMDPK